MTNGRPNPQVVHQELALDVYLSTLLEEIPQEDDVQLEEVTTAVEAPQAKQETEPYIEPVVPSITPAFIPKPLEPEIKADRQLQLVDTQVETKHQALTLMPEWSQQEFQALFFKVDNLILAAPLTDLLRTIKIERKPTKIPGQPSWFMGLLDDHQDRIGVLDTGQLVLGKSRGGQRDMDEKPFKSILITHDGRWGLACDEILSISRLTPEKVRWRTVRKKRPWLIGTVIEELIAVVDVHQLVPHRKKETG